MVTTNTLYTHDAKIKFLTRSQFGNQNIIEYWTNIMH